MSRAISVEHLSKIYESSEGPVMALEDLSFKAERGEFISVVGPSGCGKSTLLLIVAGLRAASAGRVVIDGKAAAGPQTDVGIVFQSDALLAWRTNLDNVLLQIDMRGLSRKPYVERAQDLLEAVGLSGFANKRPTELSGGMRQRVSICRALIHHPPMLLMDEPFGALDALTREQIMVDLQALWLERRSTVLFITHSIAEAVFLSDRVLVMSARPGRIEEIIEIDLPRPRDMEIVEIRKFIGYVGRIRNIFKAIGVINSGGAARKVLQIS